MPRQKEAGYLGILLVVASGAFAWIVWPFFGAILWSVLLSIIFNPAYELLLAAIPRQRNVAATATVVLIAMLVVLPLTLVAAGLVQEMSGLFERFQSGDFDVRQSLSELRSSLPEWAANIFGELESTRFADVVERFSTALMQGGQLLAGQILSIGQATVNLVLSIFVMLYLLFYLLRDGPKLIGYLENAIPVPSEQQQVLLSKFTATVRGTLKGDIVIALIQGLLGGVIFWALGIGTPILWGAVMAVLSLLPVVGTGMVWVPAAIYLFLTGFVWQAVVLLAYGALVISTIEYVLRPVLIGNDVKMPSYVVLLSSLGGIATFGVNGFVIGPLVAALCLAAWEMHLKLRGQRQDVAAS